MSSRAFKSDVIIDGKITANNLVDMREIAFDGGGSALVAGTKIWRAIGVAGNIQKVTCIADQSGSAVVAIKKCAGGSFPGSLSSIVASAPPTLSSAQYSKDTTLTGWTLAVAVDDVLEFSVTSCSTITRLVISLEILRT